MARIFISYSRQDSFLVGELVWYLKRRYGRKAVWYDKELVGGEEWIERIRIEIKDCKVFVILLSNDCLTSSHCEQEFQLALELQKAIVPVNFGPKTDIRNAPDNWQQQISRRQWVNLFEGLHQREARKRLNKAIDKEISPSRLAQGMISLLLAFLMLIIVGVVAKGTVSFEEAQQTEVSVGLIVTETNAPTLEVDSTTHIFKPTNSPFSSSGTLSPVDVAIERAREFEGENNDWQSFSHVFPDDPAAGEMMLVPVGSFPMGSQSEEADEKPVHRQDITVPFWIDRTEVTRGQYRLCVDIDLCEGTSPSIYSTRITQPVNRVTWLRARDFCAWRGMRLPTEAEWEFAARGPSGSTYPWGNSWNSDYAVWAENSNNQTDDVGSRIGGASWVGAINMSGNVWEWVSSIYSSYPYDSTHENDEDQYQFRVLRGGSFDLSWSFLSPTNRYYLLPNIVNFNVGFRCARDVT